MSQIPLKTKACLQIQTNTKRSPRLRGNLPPSQEQKTLPKTSLKLIEINSLTPEGKFYWCVHLKTILIDVAYYLHITAH
jgi:hypothetical protein